MDCLILWPNPHLQPRLLFTFQALRSKEQCQMGTQEPNSVLLSAGALANEEVVVTLSFVSHTPCIKGSSTQPS